MRVFVSGFSSFCDVDTNPSELLVSALKDDYQNGILIDGQSDNKAIFEFKVLTVSAKATDEWLQLKLLGFDKNRRGQWAEYPSALPPDNKIHALAPDAPADADVHAAGAKAEAEEKASSLTSAALSGPWKDSVDVESASGARASPIPLDEGEEQVLFLHFGVSGLAGGFNLERFAYNCANFRVADVAGWSPNNVPITSVSPFFCCWPLGMEPSPRGVNDQKGSVEAKEGEGEKEVGRLLGEDSDGMGDNNDDEEKEKRKRRTRAEDQPSEELHGKRTVAAWDVRGDVIPGRNDLADSPKTRPPRNRTPQRSDPHHPERAVIGVDSDSKRRKRGSLETKKAARGPGPAAADVRLALGEPLETKLETRRLAEDLRSIGYKVCESKDPGRYVCNYVYFSSLGVTRCRPRWNSLFVHVPPLEVMRLEDQVAFAKDLISRLVAEGGQMYVRQSSPNE